MNAQTEQYEIESAFNEYRNLIEKKEFDKAFDYYHKSFLKYIPKKDLEKEFTKLENNPNFTYSVKSSKLLSSSKIIVYDTIKYSFIKYGANTHIKFKDEVSADTKERIKEHFKKLYRENYKFSNNEIITYKEQELIGLNDSVWRFIMYKNKLKPYMSIWLPEKVLDSLLLYR
ncbi:hypothetical protein [Croceivirga radicis]|uniref:hypothetical protein n=1 Tax=Croceivirga radicis TaxID=1929488 RepID=UPI0004977D07|nr:hypothetical protein [Croceivirga radicis]